MNSKSYDLKVTKTKVKKVMYYLFCIKVFRFNFDDDFFNL